MTDHYFENDTIKLHYYKFGQGPKVMLCFHGYGMHGKQFKILEQHLGEDHTFYGFDLFFHKETVLKQQNDINFIKKGISKKELSDIFIDFCDKHDIQQFSVLSYSMGSHYAATLIEEVPERISEFITAAPSCLKPGWVLKFFSKRKAGNKILEKLSLSNNGMLRLLTFIKKTRVIDEKMYHILSKEIATYELRFSFYACLTFLRSLELHQRKFIDNLNQYQIKSVFVFGLRDWNYPAKIGNRIIPQINMAKQLVLDENHEMINSNFAIKLTELLNDH